jgi:hypothetical protein
MIVTAEVDLSEGGRKPLSEERTNVLIYAGDDFDSMGDAIDKAIAAIGRCRLIREGHVFTTEIQHSVSAGIVKHLYAYQMGEDGELWTEETGRYLP